MGVGFARTVRFGINYTPAQRWYFCWDDWDAGAVAADLDAIAALGADHIRLQLLWPSFQPNPTYVSPGHLRRLGELMTLAEARGLDVVVTLLTGFLSGYVYLPAGVSPRAVFTDERVWAMEMLLARRVLEEVGTRPNFMGLDVGNEINCLDHELPVRDGDAWARRFLEQVQPLMPGKPMVNGIDHTPLLAGSTFSMTHLARAYPIICLHAWPYFSGAIKKGRLDQAPCTHLARFFTQFVRLWGDQPQRPVWIQEFGANDLWGTFEERAAYLRQTVELAIRSGVTMFTWWCSHDKTRNLKFDEFEYVYGLYTPDNQPKDLAAVYRELVDRYAQADLSAMPAGYDCEIAVPENFRPAYLPHEATADYLERTLASNVWKIYDEYLSRVAEGKTPVLVRGKS